MDNSLTNAMFTARVLLLGMSYKPDVADYRESPSYEVLELLLDERIQVAYHDPHVPSVRVRGQVLEDSGLGDLDQYDCVIALVRHSQFDIKGIAARARLIFDTRNIFSGIAGPIVRLGDGTTENRLEAMSFH